MIRVGVAGFQHETNSFAPFPADFNAFAEADAWPGILRGRNLLDGIAGVNLPAAGFCHAAADRGWQLAPLIWCSAGPSGPVTRDAYDRITGELIERVERALPLDALYLDLHGAMVTDHLEDAEGELLTRLRAVVGRHVKIIASLDLHANVSPRMVGMADHLVAYKRYPHVDMADTGARAAVQLEKLLSGPQQAKAFRQLPFLIPLGAQATDSAPMAEMMMALDQITEDAEIMFAAGFPLADVYDAGPSVTVYAENIETAEKLADKAVAVVVGYAPEFLLELWAPAAAVAQAQNLVLSGTRGPVLLIDTQDNPGGGGTGDTVALLATLIGGQVQGAVMGILHDAASAAKAHAAGAGAFVSLHLGAGQGFAGERPLQVQALVRELGDGHFAGTGPFYQGCRFDLGPMALLEISGVLVIVGSRRQQAADQAMFRHLGVEPSSVSILALKSSIHYRADFGSMASAVIVVAAPGANIADPSALTYRRLRPGVKVAGRVNKIEEGDSKCLHKLASG